MTLWEKTQFAIVIPIILALLAFDETKEWLRKKRWPEHIYIRYTGLEHHGTRVGLCPDLVLWLRENKIPFRYEQGDIYFRNTKHAVWFKMRWL